MIVIERTDWKAEEKIEFDMMRKGKSELESSKERKQSGGCRCACQCTRTWPRLPLGRTLSRPGGERNKEKTKEKNAGKVKHVEDKGSACGRHSKSVRGCERHDERQ